MFSSINLDVHRKLLETTQPSDEMDDCPCTLLHDKCQIDWPGLSEYMEQTHHKTRNLDKFIRDMKGLHLGLACQGLFDGLEGCEKAKDMLASFQLTNFVELVIHVFPRRTQHSMFLYTPKAIREWIRRDKLMLDRITVLLSVVHVVTEHKGRKPNALIEKVLSTLRVSPDLLQTFYEIPYSSYLETWKSRKKINRYNYPDPRPLKRKVSESEDGPTPGPTPEPTPGPAPKRACSVQVSPRSVDIEYIGMIDGQLALRIHVNEFPQDATFHLECTREQLAKGGEIIGKPTSITLQNDGIRFNTTVFSRHIAEIFKNEMSRFLNNV